MKIIVKLLLGIMLMFDVELSSNVKIIWWIIPQILILLAQILRIGKPPFKFYFLYYVNFAA